MAVIGWEGGRGASSSLVIRNAVCASAVSVAGEGILGCVGRPFRATILERVMWEREVVRAPARCAGL